MQHDDEPCWLLLHESETFRQSVFSAEDQQEVAIGNEQTSTKPRISNARLSPTNTSDDA